MESDKRCKESESKELIELVPDKETDELSQESESEELSIDVPLALNMESYKRSKESESEELIQLVPDKETDELSQESESEELIIDVPLALDMEPENRCYIYKVPHKLLKGNREAYTPMLISIGPFHHGKENLRKMEELKVRYFKEACYRTKKKQKELARCVQEKEVEIRQCYSDTFYISSEDFVKMILLDSIFIIEHLWRTKQNLLKSSSSNDTSYPNSEENENSDPKNSLKSSGSNDTSYPNNEENENSDQKTLLKSSGSNGTSYSEESGNSDQTKKKYSWLSYNILRDLMLLENQVPFFVLEELYNSSYKQIEDPKVEFREFVFDYFIHFCKDYSFKFHSDYKEILKENKKVKHFTDFLRSLLVPREPKRGKSIKRLPCATKLAEAGVEFREVKNRRLLEIEFQKKPILEKFPFLNLSWLLSCFPCFKCLENMQPVLELQSFLVGDATECVIRNLMAFEQRHHPGETYICNYIVLLDHLINTAEDVDLLVEKKVLVNWLGNNKAVATLINKLCIQIVEGNQSCYYELSERIHGHYSSYWSKLMASFTSLYFRDFWRGITTVVGILVVVLTLGNFVTPFVIHR